MCKLRFEGRLCGEATLRICFRDTGSGKQTAMLHIGGRSDNPDRITPFRAATLHELYRFEHRDRHGLCRHPCPFPRDNGRMDDGLKPSQCIGVCENNRAKYTPINRGILTKDAWAELAHHCGINGITKIIEFMDHAICIERRRAK